MVTVTGITDDEIDYVIDLKKIVKLIKRKIIDKVDHKNLNLDVSFLKERKPTIEILIMEFWN